MRRSAKSASRTLWKLGTPIRTGSDSSNLGADQACELGFEGMPARLEPVALVAPLRIQRGDLIPETRRMIAHAQMTQFVHDHVLQRIGRCQREGEVERDAIARIQAAPQA